jgi:hypothetical protein
MTMRPTTAIACLVICLLVLPGCYTLQLSSSYTPPTLSLHEVRPVEVDKPLDSAWTQLIRGLATNAFDIVTMDRQTGLVSVAYTGDPEEYVDGGVLNNAVTVGPSVRHTYSYPATIADTSWTATFLGGVWRVERQVYLDGRVNIILQEAGDHRSRMTVNARYTLTINDFYQSPGTEPSTSQEVISFATGQTGKSRNGTIFQSTGRMEDAIVALVR